MSFSDGQNMWFIGESAAINIRNRAEYCPEPHFDEVLSSAKRSLPGHYCLLIC
jgi:hypothetical protein